MKLPFDLGVKLILRLLIPGFFLTLGLFPAIATLRDRAGWSLDIEYLIILSVLSAGWLITALDQPIYMLFEGRRFWPHWLRKLFLRLEDRRLKKLRVEEDLFDALATYTRGYEKKSNNQKYVEASVELRQFPLNDQGHPEASLPTRIGNLLTAYETYPNNRYGVEAIFYWYRIWLKLDKDMREELDTRQAMADTTIYVSCALFLDAILWSIYIALPAKDPPIINHLPGFLPCWLVPLTFLLFGYLCYRISVYAQAQYGESFKSVFDVYEKEINVSRVVEIVADITRDHSVLNFDRKNRLMVAWRYLHNYRVKCRQKTCENLRPMSPEDLQKHMKEVHAPDKDVTTVEAFINNYKRLLAEAGVIHLKAEKLKKLDIIVAIAGIGFAFYIRHYGLSLIVVIASVIFWYKEVGIKTQQEAIMAEIKELSTVINKAEIYETSKRSVSVRFSVTLPYWITLILGCILWFLGITKNIGMPF